MQYTRVVIGILELELHIPGSLGLKTKRSAIRPLMSTLAREFGVSVAEVGRQDAWQRAILAVAVVSGDRRQADRVLQSVLRRAADWTGEAILGTTHMELMSWSSDDRHH
jgi:uncharacterized protein YlxP (DUF503 family)